MNSDIWIGVFSTLGAIISGYVAYRVAKVNKTETPEQIKAKEIENENAFAKMHNDLIGQYRTRNAELELEVTEKDKIIANLDALNQKLRIEHIENLRSEKEKRHQMERERNAAFAALEANQRIIRKSGVGKPVEYEPPNGTTPKDVIK